MSCAVALAVLNAIEDDKLRENATIVGNHLIKRFQVLAEKHQLIGDVRLVSSSNLLV